MANIHTDLSTEKVQAPSETSDDAVAVEGINEKALLRKIDAKLLPAVGILYLLSFLDRSNGEPYQDIQPSLSVGELPAN